MRKVTLQAIADELNISVGAVSLSLNNKYGVSEEVRSAVVMKAIAMGYDFTSLKKHSNKKKITLLINNHEMLSANFWQKIITGIEFGSTKNKVLLNILCWYESIPAEDIIMSLLFSDSSGIIVINTCPEAILDSLNKLSIPVVLVDYKIHTAVEYDHIRAKNEKSFYNAAEYLFKKGHRRILFSGNIKYSLSFFERYTGFRLYLEHSDTKDFSVSYNIAAPIYDHDVNEDFLIFDRDEFRAMMKDTRPTAICCANDAVAKFVYEELAMSGLKIPDDVSVISFDNTPLCKKLSPPLSSYDVPKEEIGRQAINLLFERINTPDGFRRTLMISTTLIERDSVKAL
jgi:LacI family transcriptional regulator